MPKKKAALPPIANPRPEAYVTDPNDAKKAIKVGPQPVNTEGYSGKYHKVDEPENALPYALKVLPEDEAAGHYDHTHHLINEHHFWTGSKQQFKEQFEKI
jgi:hypothetical protein